MVRTRTIPFDRDITEELTVDDIGQASLEAGIDNGAVVAAAKGSYGGIWYGGDAGV
jgi:hypothetical protein